MYVYFQVPNIILGAIKVQVISEYQKGSFGPYGISAGLGGRDRIPHSYRNQNGINEWDFLQSVVFPNK